MAEVSIQTVLVAEDDDATRALWCQVLEAAGFRVLQAKDSETAVWRALVEHPDVLLLDFNMPGSSGLDVVGRLRNRGVTTPAVLITAVDRSTLHENAGDALADFAVLLEKPVPPQEVVAAVVGCLGILMHKPKRDTPLLERRQPNRPANPSRCPQCPDSVLRAVSRVEYAVYFRCEQCGYVTSIRKPLRFRSVGSEGS